MFQFPWLAQSRLCIHRDVMRHDPHQVSLFGDPRIKVCLRLPEAYRSLPRPSSPGVAKAFTCCP